MVDGISVDKEDISLSKDIGRWLTREKEIMKDLVNVTRYTRYKPIVKKH